MEVLFLKLFKLLHNVNILIITFFSLLVIFDTHVTVEAFGDLHVMWSFLLDGLFIL